MPYNSYFPVSYAPTQYYPSYPQMQPQQQSVQPVQTPQPVQQPVPQPMNSSIIWVQGEAGAKSYLVAPNTTVQLWDSERQTIYLKSADASGMPSIKTLDYTIRETAQNSVPLAQNDPVAAFATKDEVNLLANEITALKAELSGLTKHSEKPKKESVKDE